MDMLKEPKKLSPKAIGRIQAAREPVQRALQALRVWRIAVDFGEKEVDVDRASKLQCALISINATLDEHHDAINDAVEGLDGLAAQNLAVMLEDALWNLASGEARQPLATADLAAATDLAIHHLERVVDGLNRQPEGVLQ